jgi:hypothetical protein
VATLRLVRFFWSAVRGLGENSDGSLQGPTGTTCECGQSRGARAGRKLGPSTSAISRRTNRMLSTERRSHDSMPNKHDDSLHKCCFLSVLIDYNRDNLQQILCYNKYRQTVYIK